MEEVFCDERGDRPTMDGELTETEILEDEVEQALKEIRRETAKGSDGLAAVMLNAV